LEQNGVQFSFNFLIWGGRTCLFGQLVSTQKKQLYLFLPTVVVLSIYDFYNLRITPISKFRHIFKVICEDDVKQVFPILYSADRALDDSVYVFVGYLFFITDIPFVCFEAVSADYSIDTAFTLKESFRFVVFVKTNATTGVISNWHF